jgi:hypothetical protein
MAQSGRRSGRAGDLLHDMRARTDFVRTMLKI